MLCFAEFPNFWIISIVTCCKSEHRWLGPEQWLNLYIHMYNCTQIYVCTNNLLGAKELNISPQLWRYCQQQADNGIPPGQHPFKLIFEIFLINV